MPTATANSEPTISATMTKPIPTRFLSAEDAFLHDVAAKTGLSVSEVLRRSVRLMKKHQQMFNSYSFVLDLTPAREESELSKAA